MRRYTKTNEMLIMAKKVEVQQDLFPVAVEIYGLGVSEFKIKEDCVIATLNGPPALPMWRM